MPLFPNAPWTTFYGNTPAKLVYPEQTMYQMLRETALKYPENTAYVFMGKKTSYLMRQPLIPNYQYMN